MGDIRPPAHFYLSGGADLPGRVTGAGCATGPLLIRDALKRVPIFKSIVIGDQRVAAPSQA